MYCHQLSSPKSFAIPVVPRKFFIAFNIKQLYDSYHSLENNSDFWQNHDIDLIHSCFLKRLDIWKSAKLIEYTKFDLTKTFTSYAGNISNSKNMNIILPFYANFYAELILKFLDKNNGNLRLVTTEEIWNLIQKDNKELCGKLLENNNLELNLTDQPLKLFFTVCDNFSSLFLYLDEDSFDDSSMLLIKDKKVLYIFPNPFFTKKRYFIKKYLRL